MPAEELPVDRFPDGGLNRREFIQLLGAGLLITVGPPAAFAQLRPGRAGEPAGGTIAARVHLGADGGIAVMTGKVEGGQGARAELTQAAAEELRVPVARISLIMADTDRVPDDGITAGSRSTPSTVPAVRQGAAAARELLIAFAAARWQVDRTQIAVHDGKATHGASRRELTYADLAADEGPANALHQPVPVGVTLTPVKDWKVMGTPVPRPGGRDLVSGSHAFPSDVVRPGMLYGRILRAPSYGAKLTDIDLAPARGMEGVVVVREGPFVGVAAPTSRGAEQALEAIARTAAWESAAHPSSGKLFEYLRAGARGGEAKSSAALEPGAGRFVSGTYHVAYIQHAPLETRTAVAEWDAGRLTVWTGTQNPFGVRSELATAFELPAQRVRVIVPDFGAGFGGKHQPDAPAEAARLSRAAGKPVQVRWTRREEFTWACFRPAAVIDLEARLDARGRLTSWRHVNINSGRPAIETPYRAGASRSEFLQSDPPLRQCSYRALAATANNFARECFMDELAAAAGGDPLAFRLAHLDDPRLKAVLETAAARFDFAGRRSRRQPGTGFGLACGTEKGSYVAACAEVAVRDGGIVVRRIGQVFECGAIVNPANLEAQVTGCLLMGLGPALREEMRFENGVVLNASFREYLVPRFADVPELDVHLLNRPDLPSAGSGETPIIAVAPAIANAVFDATGRRVRQMPIRLTD